MPLARRSISTIPPRPRPAVAARERRASPPGRLFLGSLAASLESVSSRLLAIADAVVPPNRVINAAGLRGSLHPYAFDPTAEWLYETCPGRLDHLLDRVTTAQLV